NLIRRGLAHVENRLSLQMMRLDLVTHPAPPLRFPLPLFLDAASVTVTAIARFFAGHRMTALSNVDCIADEQTTAVGSISAEPPIPPSAPPASSKYRCCVSGVSSAWARGSADRSTSLSSPRDWALANPGLETRVLQQAATSNIQSGTSKTRDV